MITFEPVDIEYTADAPAAWLDQNILIVCGLSHTLAHTRTHTCIDTPTYKHTAHLRLHNYTHTRTHVHTNTQPHIIALTLIIIHTHTHAHIPSVADHCWRCHPLVDHSPRRSQVHAGPQQSAASRACL
jgi:hypothetical protein